MQIQAVSIGSRVPRAPFSGRVHSVFRAACNIDLNDRALLTVLDGARGAIPHGIGVATAAGFDFRRVIAPGERVSGDGGVVRFARFSVDVAGAPRAQTSVDHIALDMQRGSRAAWRAAWSRLASAGQADGLGALLCSSDGSDPLLRQARPRIAILMRATGALDETVATSAACGAIGMGPGLTPSWDDFLVGYLCALRATALGRRRQSEFLRALGEAVRAAAKDTSLVSRAQLEHAADGHASESLVAMLEAIAAGDTGRTVMATGQVVAVGSTSGTDTALGILCGCAVWAPRSSPRRRGPIRINLAGRPREDGDPCTPSAMIGEVGVHRFPPARERPAAR